MFKGNEKDCICEKPNGKHRKRCDAYRLSEFMTKAAGMVVESTQSPAKPECKGCLLEIKNGEPLNYWYHICERGNIIPAEYAKDLPGCQNAVDCPAKPGWEEDKDVNDFSVLAENLAAEGQTSRAEAVEYLIQRVKTAHAAGEKEGIEKCLKILEEEELRLPPRLTQSQIFLNITCALKTLLPLDTNN